MTATATTTVHPYYDLRAKIIEIDPNGQQLVDAFEAANADTDAASFEDHGACQELLRTLIKERGGDVVGPVVDWGFQEAHVENGLHNDFEVTSRPDQLIAAGIGWDDLAPEIRERIYLEESFRFREALLRDRA